MTWLFFDVLTQKLPPLFGYRVLPRPPHHQRVALANSLQKQFGGLWLWDSPRLVSECDIPPEDWTLWQQNFWTSTDPLAARTRISRDDTYVASPHMLALWAMRYWQAEHHIAIAEALRRSVRQVGELRLVSGYRMQSLALGAQPLVCATLFTRRAARESLFRQTQIHSLRGLAVVDLPRQRMGIIQRVHRSVSAYPRPVGTLLILSPAPTEQVVTVATDAGLRYQATSGQLYALDTPASQPPSVPSVLLRTIKRLGENQDFLRLQNDNR